MASTSELKETTHVTAPVALNTLSVNVFTAPGKPMVGERPKPFGEPLGFDPITSTLIFGEHDAVLVDAMLTVAESKALADWIALHNRNLETIYITHAHFDHFYGLGILLDRFPGARAIATPATLNAIQMSFTPTVERIARRLFPGQVPTRLVAPEPYEKDTFTLEGHELRIIEQGRTDSPDTTSIYVPSLGLIVAGDVVYNQCRIYVGDTTPESRKNWIAALDRLAALNPTMVVAGHKKPGAPDSPSTIQETKRYLQDFDQLQKTANSERELFDQMTELPTLGSQSVLVDVRISDAINHGNRLPGQSADERCLSEWEPSMSNVQIGQKSYEMPPREGLSIAHFLTVADIERSARYCEKVFDARILSLGDGNAPCYLQLANIWMILNVGGGPTPDKPTVTLSVPDPNHINSFMNFRVADIQASYELWKSRGAEFITEPIPKYGETRCYIRDPDGYIIEVGQSTDLTYG
jgi:glyoxylase-like metal-dependent hydrolase (beta-lactamase superfamily II)/predicted enzyme related to lactoylglutathione lyase